MAKFYICNVNLIIDQLDAPIGSIIEFTDAQRAIRDKLLKDGDIAPHTAPEPDTDPDAADDQPTDHRKVLEAMSVKDLTALAEGLDIAVAKGTKKAELVDVLFAEHEKRAAAGLVAEEAAKAAAELAAQDAAQGGAAA